MAQYRSSDVLSSPNHEQQVTYYSLSQPDRQQLVLIHDVFVCLFTGLQDRQPGMQPLAWYPPDSGNRRRLSPFRPIDLTGRILQQKTNYTKSCFVPFIPTKSSVFIFLGDELGNVIPIQGLAACPSCPWLIHCLK